MPLTVCYKCYTSKRSSLNVFGKTLKDKYFDICLVIIINYRAYETR